MRKITKYQHLHLYLLLNELHSQHWTEAQNTAGVSSGIRSLIYHTEARWLCYGADLQRLWTSTVELLIYSKVTKSFPLSYRENLEYDSLSLCDITSHF